MTVQPDTGPVVPFALNSHPGQEFNYVLNGTVKIVIGKHEMVLHEGDALYFDSSSPWDESRGGCSRTVFSSHYVRI